MALWPPTPATRSRSGRSPRSPRPTLATTSTGSWARRPGQTRDVIFRPVSGTPDLEGCSGIAPPGWLARRSSLPHNRVVPRVGALPWHEAPIKLPPSPGPTHRFTATGPEAPRRDSPAEGAAEALAEQCRLLVEERERLTRELAALEDHQIGMAREVVELRTAVDAWAPELDTSREPAWKPLEVELARVQRERRDALVRLDEATRRLLVLAESPATGEELGRLKGRLRDEAQARETAEHLIEELMQRVDTAEQDLSAALAALPAPADAEAAPREGGRRRRLALVAVPAATLAIGLAAGVLLDRTGGETREQRAPVAAAPPAPAAPPARDIPPCGDVGARPGGSVICSTASSVLTIVASRRPLVLPGAGARVLWARVAGAEAIVNLRFRNTSNGPRTLFDSRTRPYLRVGEKRISAGGGDAVQAAPGEVVTLRLRFPLDAAARTRLAESGADLAVVPLDGGLVPRASADGSGL